MLMILYIFTAALVLTIIIAPLIQKVFLKYKKYDPINKRSSHNVIATRTGGIASFGGIFLTSLFFYLNGEEIYNYSLLIPLSTMFVVGVYDDFYNADFKLKFFLQIIVAKMLIDQGLIIDSFYGVFGIEEISRIFSQIFTVFVFLIIVNSINFIDGIDGLAIIEIIKIITIFILIDKNDSSLLFVGILTIGSLIPLYFFNFKKENKIFLGDGGSLFLGTLICIYVFNFLNSSYNYSLSFNKPILSILILLYPLLDLLRVFIIRIYNKKSPFKPDNNHLHHYLLKNDMKHWKISLILPIGFFLISSILYYGISII